MVSHQNAPPLSPARMTRTPVSRLRLLECEGLSKRIPRASAMARNRVDGVQFLSPEWIAALGAAVEAVTLEPALRLRIGVRVPDAPGGAVGYTLSFADGRVTLGGDPPDATLVVGYAAAVAIAAGTRNAQAALETGDLKVAGDANALRANAGALAALPAVFAALRADTEFAS